MSEISDETLEAAVRAVRHLPGNDFHYQIARTVIECFQQSPWWLEMARDAGRYRWLRENWYAMGTMVDTLKPPGCHYKAVARAGDLEALDAAIDAAVSGGGS